MVVPGAPEPRFEAAGAVIESAPVVTVKVTVVEALGPTTIDTAVLVVAAHAAADVSPVATMAAAPMLRQSTLRMKSPREGRPAPAPSHKGRPNAR